MITLPPEPLSKLPARTEIVCASWDYSRVTAVLTGKPEVNCYKQTITLKTPAGSKNLSAGVAGTHRLYSVEI